MSIVGKLGNDFGQAKTISLNTLNSKPKTRLPLTALWWGRPRYTVIQASYRPADAAVGDHVGILGAGPLVPFCVSYLLCTSTKVLVISWAASCGQ